MRLCYKNVLLPFVINQLNHFSRDSQAPWIASCNRDILKDVEAERGGLCDAGKRSMCPNSGGEPTAATISQSHVMTTRFTSWASTNSCVFFCVFPSKEKSILKICVTLAGRDWVLEMWAQAGHYWRPLGFSWRFNCRAVWSCVGGGGVLWMCGKPWHVFYGLHTKSFR